MNIDSLYFMVGDAIYNISEPALKNIINVTVNQTAEDIVVQCTWNEISMHEEILKGKK